MSETKHPTGCAVCGGTVTGTGQHAVNILLLLHGTYWNHVLVYDKNDKRTEVIKYVGGYYRS